MVYCDLLKAKLLCLQVLNYVLELAETAAKDVSKMEESDIDSNKVLTACNLTLQFTSKIIDQMTDYRKTIKNTIIIIETDSTTSTEMKKDCIKKNIFSLKKEKNEQYTEDEFLEIYKIDMTEEIFHPERNKMEDSLNKDNGINCAINLESNFLDDSKSDKSLKECESAGSTLSLLDNLDTISLNEVDILNNIGCELSDIESECGSTCSGSIYSGSTFVLETNRKSQHRDSLNSSLVLDNDDLSLSEKGKDENLHLKECSVVLYNCEEITQKSVNNEEREMRQIETLVNLDNLNRKRKLSGDIKSNNKGKRLKRCKNKNVSSTNSDMSDSSITDISFKLTEDSQDESSEILENSFINKQPSNSRDNTDFINILLNCISDISDLIEDTSDEDDSSTDVAKENTIERRKAKKLQNSKEEKTDKDQTEISETLRVNNCSSEEFKKKKRWRRDKLLTGKLTDGSTDDEKENAPVQRRKSTRLRRTRLKNNDINPNKVTSSETDCSSDSDFDNESAKNLSLSSTDSSTDIEFKEPVKEENQSEDHAKTGRRNIRMVQSNLLLAETTKQALRAEEERRDRLLPRTQILSQVTEEEGLVLDIDKQTDKPLIVVDENITQRLKPHQKEGVRFMWNNCYESVESLKKDEGTGCILAHCMGLGKTFQVTALIDTIFAHTVTNTNHVLIVCPLSTVLNWENEFKICFDISRTKRKINRFLITDGKSKAERHRIVINWRKNKGVLILGYDSFQSLLKMGSGASTAPPKGVIEALLDPGPDLVVCDEGHLIRNGNKNRAKVLMKIKTKRRIILTGTPMQNNLTEYYYMVDFVKPNLLGTKTEFSNRFTNPIINGGYDDSTVVDIKLMQKRSHVLHEYLKDTIQRYEMSELQSYLPEKLDYVLFVRLHSLQVELYKAYLELVRAPVIERKKKFLSDFLQLRNVWTHPCILRLREQYKQSHQNRRREVDTIAVEPEIQEDMPNEWWHPKCPDDLLANIEYGPKMEVMLEIIEQSVRLNDKVLIFGTNLAELDAIEYFLQENGWRKDTSYCRMDGTVPPNTRVDLCNKFNDERSQIKLFVLSHQVGGLGLNLIGANRIILMDVNFNPAIDTQSIFRTYRFGQTKRCYVYRLVSMGTMEEVVYERSITKLAVSLRVVDEHQISRHYKSNDLQEMYRFNIYTDEQRPLLKLPVDDVLATILENCKEQVFKYHEHQDLLENRPEEQLNEDEQKLAWVEFRKEQLAYENEVAANILRMQSMQNNLENQSSNPNPLPAQQQSENSTNPIQPEVMLVGNFKDKQSNIQNTISKIHNDVPVIMPTNASVKQYHITPNVNISNMSRPLVAVPTANMPGMPKNINVISNGMEIFVSIPTASLKQQGIRLVANANMQQIGNTTASANPVKPIPSVPHTPHNNFAISQRLKGTTEMANNSSAIKPSSSKLGQVANPIMQQPHNSAASGNGDKSVPKMNHFPLPIPSRLKATEQVVNYSSTVGPSILKPCHLLPIRMKTPQATRPNVSNQINVNTPVNSGTSNVNNISKPIVHSNRSTDHIQNNASHLNRINSSSKSIPSTNAVINDKEAPCVIELD